MDIVSGTLAKCGVIIGCTVKYSYCDAVQTNKSKLTFLIFVIKSTLFKGALWSFVSFLLEIQSPAAFNSFNKSGTVSFYTSRYRPCCSVVTEVAQLDKVINTVLLLGFIQTSLLM